MRISNIVTEAENIRANKPGMPTRADYDKLNQQIAAAQAKQGGGQPTKPNQQPAQAQPSATAATAPGTVDNWANYFKSEPGAPATGPAPASQPANNFNQRNAQGNWSAGKTKAVKPGEPGSATHALRNLGGGGAQVRPSGAANLGADDKIFTDPTVFKTEWNKFLQSLPEYGEKSGEEWYTQNPALVAVFKEIYGGGAPAQQAQPGGGVNATINPNIQTNINPTMSQNVNVNTGQQRDRFGRTRAQAMNPRLRETREQYRNRLFEQRILFESQMRALPITRAFINLGNYITEAKLTQQQIEQIFQQVAQGAAASGNNRTFLGRGADAVIKPVATILQKALNNPVTDFANTAIDNIQGQLSNWMRTSPTAAKAYGPQVMKALDSYEDWAKKHPNLRGFLFTVAAGVSGMYMAGHATEALAIARGVEKLAAGATASDAASGALINAAVSEIGNYAPGVIKSFEDGIHSIENTVTGNAFDAGTGADWGGEQTGGFDAGQGNDWGGAQQFQPTDSMGFAGRGQVNPDFANPDVAVTDPTQIATNTTGGDVTAPAPAPAGGDSYTVTAADGKQGLGGIAKQYPGISTQDLMDYNGLTTTVIKPGQVIEIPPQNVVSPSDMNNNIWQGWQGSPEQATAAVPPAGQGAGDAGVARLQAQAGQAGGTPETVAAPPPSNVNAASGHYTKDGVWVQDTPPAPGQIGVKGSVAPAPENLSTGAASGNFQFDPNTWGTHGGHAEQFKTYFDRIRQEVPGIDPKELQDYMKDHAPSADARMMVGTQTSAGEKALDWARKHVAKAAANESVLLPAAFLKECIDYKTTVRAWVLNEELGRSYRKPVFLTPLGVDFVFAQVVTEGAGWDKFKGWMGKAADSAENVLGGIKQAAGQGWEAAANKISYPKLSLQWRKGPGAKMTDGSIDSEEVAKFLRDQGVNKQIIDSVFQQLGINANDAEEKDTDNQQPQAQQPQAQQPAGNSIFADPNRLARAWAAHKAQGPASAPIVKYVGTILKHDNLAESRIAMRRIVENYKSKKNTRHVFV